MIGKTIDPIRPIQVITFSRNYGYQASITAGMRHATGEGRTVLHALPVGYALDGVAVMAGPLRVRTGTGPQGPGLGPAGTRQRTGRSAADGRSRRT